MKKPIYLLLTLVVLLFSFAALSAQVKFKIAWLENEQAYQVSLLSEATWGSPENLTSSAQISLKAPAGSLDIFNVKSLQNSVKWEYNSRQQAPTEAPGFDYFSFGLATMGTDGLVYQQGNELPLFTFQNANGCKGHSVELVDNEEDPFMPPNQSNANIGNSITIYGAGGDAYRGISGNKKAVCESASDAAETTAVVLHGELFPTPVTEVLYVGFDWQSAPQDVSVRIYDLAGKVAYDQKHTVTKGENRLSIGTETFKAGVYSLDIQTEGNRQTIGRFVKQ
jgi:hypothetical protein